MVNTWKKYEIRWTLTGKCYVKARSRGEAYDKAMENEDISDPSSNYEVDRVEEIK